jgi:hypothetical protein
MASAQKLGRDALGGASVDSKSVARLASHVNSGTKTIRNADRVRLVVLYHHHRLDDPSGYRP